MSRTNRVYGLDLRSLNLFRIALGSVLLAHLIVYVALNFSTTFSPETGVLGNRFAQDYSAAYNTPNWLFSIDGDVGMWSFIAIRVLFLLLFISGLYPRVAAFVSSILLWVFHVRFNVLFIGWEMYASVLLTWSVFLPWNRKWGTGSREWRSPLTFVLLFQVGFIYFYNGISKNGPKWMDGTAVKFFLAESDKARPLAASIIEVNWLTTALTYYTLMAELAILLLLFIPFRNMTLRWVALLMIFTLHWGIDLFIDVGYFKWFATCVALLLVPGHTWDSLKEKFNWSKVFPKREFSLGNHTTRMWAERIISVYLLFVILESNLYHTTVSKTPDRVKLGLNALRLNKPIERLMPDWWPQYSFFRQFWHLYSPDPPEEKGYMQIEFVTDVGTKRVSNGRALENGKLYSNAPEQHIMMFLTLRRFRNKREEIALKSKLMYEIERWNQHEGNPPIKSVEVVLYSYRPTDAASISALPPAFERIVLQTVDIAYRNRTD